MGRPTGHKHVNHPLGSGLKVGTSEGAIQGDGTGRSHRTHQRGSDVGETEGTHAHRSELEHLTAGMKLVKVEWIHSDYKVLDYSRFRVSSRLRIMEARTVQVACSSRFKDLSRGESPMASNWSAWAGFSSKTAFCLSYAFFMTCWRKLSAGRPVASSKARLTCPGKSLGPGKQNPLGEEAGGFHKLHIIEGNQRLHGCIGALALNRTDFTAWCIKSSHRWLRGGSFPVGVHASAIYLVSLVLHKNTVWS